MFRWFKELQEKRHKEIYNKAINKIREMHGGDFSGFLDPEMSALNQDLLTYDALFPKLDGYKDGLVEYWKEREKVNKAIAMQNLNMAEK